MTGIHPFRHLLLALLLLLGGTAFSQSHQRVIDSLRRVYQTEAYDGPTATLDLLSRIAQEFQYIYPDSAIVYARKVIRISETESRSCPVCLARAYNALGTAERQEGEYTEALVSFNQALAIYQSQADQAGITSVLDNLGLIARKLGQYPKAMEYFNRSLAVRQMVADSVGIARSFSVIAKIEIDHSQFAEAIAHLRIAASVFQKYRLPYELGTTWNDLGKAAIAQSHHDEALKYYMQAIDLWKTLDDKVQVQDSLSAYAVVFLEQKQYDKALVYLDAAIAFTARLNKRADVLDLTYLKGLALVGVGKPMEAARVLIPTAQEAQSVGRTRFEIKCYEQIIAVLDAAADKKQGDYYRQQLEEAKHRL